MCNPISPHRLEYERRKLIHVTREIIDESDVYIDVHKAIRRLAPAPRARAYRGALDRQGGKQEEPTLVIGGDDSGDGRDSEQKRRGSASATSDSPSLSNSLRTTLMLRRSSAGLDGQAIRNTVPVRANLEEMKQHLRHLGPSNPATNPKETRSTTVKVKPPGAAAAASLLRLGSPLSDEVVLRHEDDETTSLLKPHPRSAGPGTPGLRQNYGSLAADDATPKAGATHPIPEVAVEDSDDAKKAKAPSSSAKSSQHHEEAEGHRSGGSSHSNKSDSSNAGLNLPKRTSVRSGSITENIIESRGVRKVVLETIDSSSGGAGDTITATAPPGSVLVIPAAPEEESASAAGPSSATSPPQSSAAGTVGEQIFSEGDEEEEGDGEGAAGEGSAATAGGPSEGAASQAKGAGKKKSRRKKRKGGGRS